MKKHLFVLSAVLLFACAVSSSVDATLVGNSQSSNPASSHFTFAVQSSGSSYSSSPYSSYEAVSSLNGNTLSAQDNKQSACLMNGNANRPGYMEWSQRGFGFGWSDGWNFRWPGRWNDCHEGESDTPSAAPIPNAIWLLGSGLLGLVVIRNRTS